MPSVSDVIAVIPVVVYSFLPSIGRVCVSFFFVDTRLSKSFYKSDIMLRQFHKLGEYRIVFVSCLTSVE